MPQQVPLIKTYSESVLQEEEQKTIMTNKSVQRQDGVGVGDKLETKPIVDSTKLNNNSSDASQSLEIPLTEFAEADGVCSNSNSIIDNSSIDATAITSASSTTAAAADNSKPQQQVTKLNGLKNRIIQRPPPLVLDKISNFDDNDTNGCIVQPQPQRQKHHQLQHQNQLQQNIAADVNNINVDNSGSTIKKDQSQHSIESRSNLIQYASITDDALAYDRASSTNNANEKFWASLSENASRNKALANARNLSSSTTTTTTTNEANKFSTLPPPPSKDVTDSLGPDLIIKHRNNTDRLASNRVTSSKKYLHQNNQNNQDHNDIYDSHAADTYKEYSQKRQHNNDSGDESAKLRYVLNNSADLDDGGASENCGGNLIGVDNYTPPAVDLHNGSRFDNPPTSASSSQPRSNNPFLDNDDNLDCNEVSRYHDDTSDKESAQLQNNFHKRPASFIAATEKLPLINRSSINEQQIVEEKFSELQFNDQQFMQNRFISHTDVPYSTEQPMTQENLADQSLYHVYQPTAQLHNANANGHHMNSYELFNQRTYDSNNYHLSNQESKINVDSESAARQPPPSATMQLPHWTDAIYELKNAILESSSVAGGAENGKFIYIVESGDIILELDSIKVSGLTLIEFNELVESKQFHLLKAVQTKHSHGLTNDLKDYLALSLPKDSKDKLLQNIIRENIYRRTIPCTTRPPKQGEVDKIDYHFLTKEQFIELSNQDMLLECGVYGDHYYGTLKPLCDLNNLLLYSPTYQKRDVSDGIHQPWDTQHPAIEMQLKKDMIQNNGDNPLYENHESLRMQQRLFGDIYSTAVQNNGLTQGVLLSESKKPSSIVAVDSEALPQGWERVIDQTHGTYYIDHNTQRTQYEQPYEVELTKGSMGFGFTLVEADNGLLLVRSIIQGGPTHMNGLIRPGDILISAQGISVTGLQHTDIARLFSTFAVGDRVRLTFARSNYVLDDSLVPDEYLFSNGTNGDLAVAVSANHFQLNQGMLFNQSPHIIVNQEFEFAKVTLKRGEGGFGFEIGSQIAGHTVRKIQNREVCSNLKHGDVVTCINDEDITQLSHNEVVERLKNFPPGQDVTLTVKRKKRFRSKTPMAMHTDASDKYSLGSTPQRNCKTPSLDGLMLRRPVNYDSMEQSVSRNLFQPQQLPLSQHNNTNLLNYSSGHVHPAAQVNLPDQQIYGSLPLPIHRQPVELNQEPFYSFNSGTNQLSKQQQPVYYNHHTLNSIPLISNTNEQDLNNGTATTVSAKQVLNQTTDKDDNESNSVHASETSLPQPVHAYPNMLKNELSQLNQYNDFMNNDKLVMMQMQQQGYQSSDYHQVPLYSNSEIINGPGAQHSHGMVPSLPVKPPLNAYLQNNMLPVNNFQNNFYANNEEIASQNIQCNGLPFSDRPIIPSSSDHFNFIQSNGLQGAPAQQGDQDEYELHYVTLVKENADSNWGIRLIGGADADAESDRAISIGSMIFGGVAAKSGKLKSGDEIISIDNVNVVGATHGEVVKLISARTTQVTILVRRKKFAEACDVVLTKNMDEGFGFVIISSENCALIGKIIENSPADRCKQLRVKDCIIAVNGRYITPDMKHPEIVNMIKECGSTLRLKIIPVDSYTVKLVKDPEKDSFGFTMRGGSEYENTPLFIVRVEKGGQAQGLLNVGDQILEINNIPTVGMTHQQAATIIKYSDPIVKLKLRRNFETPPVLFVDSPRSLQKYNQVTAEMKTVSHNMTPNHLISAHDSLNHERLSTNQASFSSLPANLNSANHQRQVQQQLHHQQQPVYAHEGRNHPTERPEPIYGLHSLNYLDQNTLYAT